LAIGVWLLAQLLERARSSRRRELVVRSEELGYILYLREFFTEEQKTLKFGGFLSPMTKFFSRENMAAELAIIVRKNLVALGRSDGYEGASLRMGPEYVFVKNEEWENKVLDLMGKAYMIFLEPSKRGAVIWEIRQIVEKGYLDKTIFIMNVPPNAVFYDEFRDLIAKWLPDFPGYQSGKQYLYFDREKNLPIYINGLELGKHPLFQPAVSARRARIMSKVLLIILPLVCTILAAVFSLNLALGCVVGLVIYFIVIPSDPPTYGT